MIPFENYSTHDGLTEHIVEVVDTCADSFVKEAPFSIIPMDDNARAVRRQRTRHGVEANRSCRKSRNTRTFGNRCRPSR